MSVAQMATIYWEDESHPNRGLHGRQSLWWSALSMGHVLHNPRSQCRQPPGKTQWTLLFNQSKSQWVSSQVEVLWTYNTWEGNHNQIYSVVTIYLYWLYDRHDSQHGKIQSQLNQFVLENTDSTEGNNKNSWMKADLLYAPADKGGRNLINVRHYFKGLKLSWLRRYAILKYDDHWCDLIDSLQDIQRN